MNDENGIPMRSGFGTRLLALVALATFVSGVGYVAQQGYRAMTDSFVAPIILTPQNDMVLASKLKLSELAVEHAKAKSQADALEADVAACDEAVERLQGLRHSVSNALSFAKLVNARQASAGARELSALRKQKRMLAAMTAEQERLATEAQKNLRAGLVGKTDYAREVQALNQLQVMLLENDRTQIQSELSFHQVTLARDSLARQNGAAPMPEVLLREDQMVRIDLELMKLQSERRAKIAERKVVEEKLGKIDELEGQLKGRPIFRAVDHTVDAAFVPYTQIEGVGAGAEVYDCVWGLVHCRRVGTVAEVVPGEVVLPDPWGNQSRGQYAVLELSDHEAARSKTLRIRRGTGAPAVAPAEPQIVSSR